MLKIAISKPFESKCQSKAGNLNQYVHHIMYTPIDASFVCCVCMCKSVYVYIYIYLYLSEITQQ